MHVVAARLGHADPSVNLRDYAHVIQDLTPAVADTFARAVNATAEAEQHVDRKTPVSRGVGKSR